LNNKINSETVTVSKHKLEEWGAFLFTEGFMCAKDKAHVDDAYGTSRRDNAVAKKILDFFPKPKKSKSVIMTNVN
jgi:hypothetical protein